VIGRFIYVRVYTNGDRRLFKVHANELIMVHSFRSSLVVTHPSTDRERRRPILTSVNEQCLCLLEPVIHRPKTSGRIKLVVVVAAAAAATAAAVVIVVVVVVYLKTHKLTGQFNTIQTINIDIVNTNVSVAQVWLKKVPKEVKTYS